MPKASRFPRKYKSQIEDAHDRMMYIVKSTRSGIDALKTKRSIPELMVIFHEIRSETLEAAHLLQEIEVAESCGECPLAPPLTSAHSLLVVMAAKLEQIADSARKHALGEGDQSAKRDQT